MTSSRKLLIAAALLGTVTSISCAGGSQPETAGAAPPSEASVARLEALYRARSDRALAQVSEADVHFMTGMIHHHAQALVMAAMAASRGASGPVRTLTARITNAQRDEIRVMRLWLLDRDRSAPEVEPGGQLSGGPDGAMTMPGMLSPEQLDDLAQSDGREYDRLFLTYMIQHHNGAVTMVHDLFATDGAAQDELVFKLASDIQVDQTTEVARMQQMLDALPSSPKR